MSIESLINRSCIIVRRGEDTDDFDDLLPDESYVDTTWELQQQSRTEPAEAGEVSVTTWSAFFPPGTELDSGDAVLDVEDGSEYQLTGAPWPVRNARTGIYHHVEATVVQTRGPGGS